ncbi:PREDICTED: uncharacterized protein LOC105956240 isoform X2 [Erythranthe guttata]|uniref:uncharacterized protein LOC105956240 isoform X2 n=1 Tax=Erythranthe guttata TaxID=4155 RepID=UPI00064DD756|nr:PREDICTED: uncharacterized protein LOC105956240 isoform X2 [Erythranthe guttata]|eukprot:XP_012835539.1 PREDICTED: uncharacterized protein LOC105956240 isoform X2 [Erythranthe guttata]
MCYKIHGYPPGYATRRSSLPPTRPHAINQASITEIADAPNPAEPVSMDNLLQSLSSSQCQQLMTLFDSQLTLDQGSNSHHFSTSNNVTCCVSGSKPEDDWQG